MKVPPESETKIMFTRSGASFKSNPSEVPTGVAKAKSTINLRSYLKSLKDF
jgi:hypothetical protein